MLLFGKIVNVLQIMPAPSNVYHIFKDMESKSFDPVPCTAFALVQVPNERKHSIHGLMFDYGAAYGELSFASTASNSGRQFICTMQIQRNDNIHTILSHWEWDDIISAVERDKKGQKNKNDI